MHFNLTKNIQKESYTNLLIYKLLRSFNHKNESLINTFKINASILKKF